MAALTLVRSVKDDGTGISFSMRRSAYRKQLEQDLARWAAGGAIDPAKIPALLADAGPPTRQFALGKILGFLGAIMLACAAIVFVSANWQILARSAKLLILAATMWGIYGAAITLMRREQLAFAQAAVLLGVAMFGANVMLIGQIYHLNAGWPNGVLIWGVGAAIAAFLVPSHASAVAAIGLLTTWTLSSSSEFDLVIHWPFLPALAAMAAYGVWQRWTPAIHLCIIALMVWLVVNTVTVVDHLDGSGALAAFALVGFSLALWLSGQIAAAQDHRYGPIVAGYGLAALAVTTFVMQLAGGDPLPNTTAGPAAALFGSLAIALIVIARIRQAIRNIDTGVAVLVLLAGFGIATLGKPPEPGTYLVAFAYIGFVIWLVSYGLAERNALAVNFGFVAFGADILYLYFETFGTLLAQSAFFAVGGLILIAAAFGLEHMRRRLLRPES